MVYSRVAEVMSTGGDARIILDSETGLNRYHASPYPRDMLTYASSTANDLSEAAHDWLQQRWAGREEDAHNPQNYTAFLEEARARILQAYSLDADTRIVFAPSGTDLEYVGLFALPHSPAGVVNLLIGGDEVGSGCIHSAAGNYFAQETALGHDCTPGDRVPGMPPVEMVDIPVRSAEGDARDSASVAADMRREIATAVEAGKPVLAHVVHGSKTGLILPHLEEVDALARQYAGQLLFVVDACQARITSSAIEAYLKRGMIVMLTGSKFMGGPPFSGFALLPKKVVADAPALPDGAAHIFRSAEFPEQWSGQDRLEESGNAGLALRLDASLFELERFQLLDIEDVFDIIRHFVAQGGAAAHAAGMALVASAAMTEAEEVREHPLEMQSLLTIDLCHDASGQLHRSLNFDDAVRIHKQLIDTGIRLGQPVRSIRLPDGAWGATLRIGLSMPQVTEIAAMAEAQRSIILKRDMEHIFKSLAAVLAEQVVGS